MMSMALGGYKQGYTILHFFSSASVAYSPLRVKLSKGLVVFFASIIVCITDTGPLQ